MAWPEARLGDLCDVQIGRTPKRAEQRYWDEDHAWLSISDMNQGRELVTTSERISQAAVDELNCRLVEPGTVLLSFKLSIGKVGIASRPMFTNEAIAHLPIVDDRIERDYLYWALRSARLTVGADRAAMGATLNKAKLKQIPIPLPPIEEQRRIAAVLDAADALRAKRRQALAKLDSLTEAVFIDMFGDPNDESGDGTQLADLVRSDDKINYGVVQPGGDVENGAPLIRVSDLVQGVVEHSGIKLIAPDIDKKYSRSKLRGDEVLISCVGSTGIVALASENEAGWNIAGAVARVPLDDSVRREYVATFLRSPFVQRYFENELRTVSQPTLNTKQIKATPIKVPAPERQSEFVARLTDVTEVRQHQIVASVQVETLFASLQQHAFQGEL